MHDNGELEEIDKTQLENEFPMPKEIEAMKIRYRIVIINEKALN